MRKRIYTRPIEGYLAWTNKGYFDIQKILRRKERGCKYGAKYIEIV